MAGTKRDYYEVLGVNKDADAAAIKRAFKRLAIKYHPDHNKDPDAGEKFREINEAYQVLSDPQKRQIYDQYGFEGLNGAAAGGGAGGFNGGNFSDIFGDSFSDIFADLFGGGGRPGRNSSASRREQLNRGRDMRIHVELTLEEAVKGVQKKVNVKLMDECPDCHGSGSKSGRRKTCPYCHGTGQVVMQQGPFRMAQECPHCHGVGEIADDPCPKCRGTGRVQRTKTLNISIPAGVDNGDRIRLAGQGEPGINGAPNGNLYVDIVVAHHDLFERDGNDLYCTVPVSFTTAALGGQVEVQTLDGRINLTIKPETQTGTMMRIPGKGVRSYNSSAAGNLYCRVVVETPVNLNSKQKDLLRQLEASLNGEDESPERRESVRSAHKPKRESLKDSIKQFFNDLKN